MGLARARGQGTRGGVIGFSFDGSFQNTQVVGTQVSELFDTTGPGGFAWAIANDGADPINARGFLLTNGGARNLTREGWHQEDASYGVQLIGVQVLDAERALRVIATAQGKTVLANYLAVFADSMKLGGLSFVTDTLSIGLENINIGFNLIRDWGKDSAADGIAVAGNGGSKINVLGNHLRSGTGDGIHIQCSGEDTSAGTDGGIAVSFNHLEDVSGFAFSIDPSGGDKNGKILITSDNTLSNAASGLAKTTAAYDLISTDQRTVVGPFTAGAAQADVIALRARRAGAIANLWVIFNSANNSTTTNTLQIWKTTSAGVSTQIATLSITALGEAAFTSRRFTSSVWPTAANRQFASGDVIWVRRPATGNGTYQFSLQIEYFEHW